jgi:hypothetical protein
VVQIHSPRPSFLSPALINMPAKSVSSTPRLWAMPGATGGTHCAVVVRLLSGLTAPPRAGRPVMVKVSVPSSLVIARAAVGQNAIPLRPALSRSVLGRSRP